MTKQSKTLKPEGLSIEERVIEEFRDKFGNLDDKTYKIIHGDREMCMYCGHPSSRDTVFRNLEDFILKSIKQAKQEYKEELLKKMPERKTIVGSSSYNPDGTLYEDESSGYCFNECRQQIINIINNEN